MRRMDLGLVCWRYFMYMTWWSVTKNLVQCCSCARACLPSFSCSDCEVRTGRKTARVEQAPRGNSLAGFLYRQSTCTCLSLPPTMSSRPAFVFGVFTSFLLATQVSHVSGGSCRESKLCCPGRDSSCVVQKAPINAIIEDLSDKPCYCDHACLKLGDCCSDFKDACGGKYLVRVAKRH
jgi:hypothetical protein